MYNAKGTALGELAYVVRARIGRAHCGLCAITHGRVRERADWRACRARLPVRFVTYHRNDQPESIRLASGGRAPVVVAEMTDGALVVLLGPDDVERCGGSPERLVEAVQQAATDAGLALASA